MESRPEQAAFIIAEKLDLGRRRPPPSITRVFRLYFHDLLSASKVARICRCSKAAVIRRLTLIRKLTGLSLGRLKIHYPKPGFIDGLRSDTSTARMNRDNILYAGIEPDPYA